MEENEGEDERDGRKAVDVDAREGGREGVDGVVEAEKSRPTGEEVGVTTLKVVGRIGGGRNYTIGEGSGTSSDQICLDASNLGKQREILTALVSSSVTPSSFILLS